MSEDESWRDLSGEEVLPGFLVGESNLSTDPQLSVKLSTRSSEIEIVEGSAQVGILAPGEERTVKFAVIARGAGSSMKFPISIEAISSNRRVGLCGHCSRAD